MQVESGDPTRGGGSSIPLVLSLEGNPKAIGREED